MLNQELRSKEKLTNELNDKRMRLSRSVHWLEHKLERVEVEKVEEEQIRHDIRKSIKIEEEERSKQLLRHWTRSPLRVYNFICTHLHLARRDKCTY
jgi:hypothetical protein